MLRRISEDYIVNVLKNHDQLILSCQVELINIFKSKDEVGMIESASKSQTEAHRQMHLLICRMY